MVKIIRKINLVGKNILAHRKEYLKKEYPLIVKNALKSTVENILLSINAGLSIYEAFGDEEINQETFESLLMNNSNFIMTKDEILSEMKSVAKVIEELLQNSGVYEVPVKPEVEEDSYSLSMNIQTDKGFLAAYFDLDKEKLSDFIKPMGVGEKFLKLRLNKIGQDIEKESVNYLSKGKVIMEEVSYSRGDALLKISYIFKNDEILLGTEKESLVLEFKKFKDFVKKHVEERLVI